MIQIEGVLNSQPLTYVNYQRDEPLTPSQLVTGRQVLSVPPESQDKYLKTALEHFWKRWSSEYLTQLREHRKPSQKHGPVVNVGDVSVQEDNVKRLNWQ